MKKSFLIFFSIVTIVSLIAFSMQFVNAVPPKVFLSPSDYDTGLTYSQAFKQKKPMAVNFYVDWCHYCQKFAPTLEKIRQQYKSKMNVVLVKADDPKNKKLVEDFGISGYPSFYLVSPKNDNRVFINQALYADLAKLKKEIDRFLKVNK